MNNKKLITVKEFALEYGIGTIKPMRWLILKDFQ